MNKVWYSGKALDNKLGGYLLYRLAKRLTEGNERFGFDLCLVNSNLEETDGQGAQMLGQRLQRDYVFVLDASHDNRVPMSGDLKESDAVCGKGPLINNWLHVWF